MEVFLHPSILKADGSKYLLNRFRLRHQVSNNFGSTGSGSLTVQFFVTRNYQKAIFRNNLVIMFLNIMKNCYTLLLLATATLLSSRLLHWQVMTSHLLWRVSLLTSTEGESRFTSPNTRRPVTRTTEFETRCLVRSMARESKESDKPDRSTNVANVGTRIGHSAHS